MFKNLLFFVCVITSSVIASELEPLGRCPTKISFISGQRMNISPGKRGGIDVSPSFQDWWKLMNFCVTKNSRLTEDSLLVCFSQTFQPNAVDFYASVFQGLLSIHFVLEGCHKDLMQSCAANTFPKVGSSVEDKLPNFPYTITRLPARTNRM